LELALRTHRPGERTTVARRIAATGVLLLALGTGAPGRADDDADFGFPQLQDTTPRDGQDYSYYYVPHLSELNQLVGYLFRSGLVRKDAPEPIAAITRYAAYSCEGTMYVGGDAEPRASEDVDWSAVTGLRAGPSTGPPSLVIERTPATSRAGKPLVLYVPDATIRYQLHQALAVLVSECRPRAARTPVAPGDSQGN